MDHMIRLSDASGSHVALLTLSEAEAQRPAIDVVFDLIGAEDLEALVTEGRLAEAHVDELRAIQQLVFDRDAEGLFIRDGVTFTANQRELDPDEPMAGAFVPMERDGMAYKRCELVVAAPAGAAAPAPASQAPAPAESEDELIQRYALMMLLHQFSIGHTLDVTRDYPFLASVLEEAERKAYIEINVSAASYKLTAAGRSQHESLMREAQELIRRFDVYGDVAVDSNGQARFDTGMGEDWRIPAFELAGIDPFKARFLLGLNDGEWNDLPDWHVLCVDASWYEEVFAPIEAAPSVDDIGRDRLLRVVDQAQKQPRHGN